MIVETFPVGLLQCNCTVLGDPVSKEAIVVDPGDEVEKVLAVLQRLGLTCKAILNTHTHIDHVGANHALREQTGARVMLHEADLPLYDNLKVQAEWKLEGYTNEEIASRLGLVCRSVERKLRQIRHLWAQELDP